MDSRLIIAMCGYDTGDRKRIAHFLKVYAYAKTIGELEELTADEMRVLESAAVLHDIGIMRSVEKYGSDAGEYQQIEGPPEARKIMGALNYSAADIERVCHLIAHHHDYKNINGADYQILIEADLLVNFEEGNLPHDGGLFELFKTPAGKELYYSLFPKN